MFALLFFITVIFTDTTSTNLYIQGNYGQATMPIDGKSNSGFDIAADAIFDINPTNRVFGNISYSWNKSVDNQWVEIDNWEKLYPYLNCDTVGGGMKNERYYFYGGYRMMSGHCLWHIALQFQAEQSYRSVDPRPKNRVTYLAADASLGYIFGLYACSFTFYGGRYKQNSTVKFMSGKYDSSPIYHMTSTSEWADRFASAVFDESYYHGATAGGGCQLLPQSRGWSGGIDYNFSTYTKDVLATNNFTFGKIKSNDVNITAGYILPNAYLFLYGAMRWRRGFYSIFGDMKSDGVQVSGMAKNFLDNQWSIGLKGSVSWAVKRGKLTPTIQANYLHKAIKEEFSTVLFATLGEELRSSQINLFASLRYVLPMHKKFNCFFQPLANFDYFMLSAHFSWRTGIQIGFSF